MTLKHRYRKFGVPHSSLSRSGRQRPSEKGTPMSENDARTGALRSGLRFVRRFGAGLTTATVLGSGLIAAGATPAAAVSRTTIVSVAQSQLNNSSRNHEQPAGSGCN